MCIRDRLGLAASVLVLAILPVRLAGFFGHESLFDTVNRLCLLYTSPSHETVLDLVCRLLLENKQQPGINQCCLTAKIAI